VDYIVSKTDGLYPYIGSRDRLHPLIKHSDSGIYLGNTANLSRAVDKQAQGDAWHLPEDVPPDYMRQFVNQFDKEEQDRHGNTVTRWITRRPDHYRDAENMIYGFAIAIGLDEAMFADNSHTVNDSENIEFQNSPTNATRTTNDNPNPYFAGIQARFNKRSL
jgi:hypothetical protein